MSRTHTFTIPAFCATFRQEKFTDPLTGSFGYRRVSDGDLAGVLEITIDLDQITCGEMGRRALTSKGKKSIDGPVTVRAHSVRKVQP